MTTDKQKEEDRRTRIQHPHMIKSKAHWESGYSEYDESADQKDKTKSNSEAKK